MFRIFGGKKEKKLVFGLGNPGRDYAGTLHNAGFQALDEMAKKFGVSVDRKRKNALTAEIKGGVNALLVKPQDYMNKSGKCVLEFAAYYKTQPGDIIVIYDDIDLRLGDIRIRAKGGAGTHNGMRDIIKMIGTQDFPRVRVGIGPKPERWDLADYVLSKPKGEDAQVLNQAYERAADAAICILEKGVEQAQAQYNAKGND